MRGMRGFTYLGILFMVLIVGFAMATAGVVWSTAVKREREQQLLWTGNQIRRAIAGFYLNGPPGLREYPRELADLLEDRRGPVLRRHLRRLYADPMTGQADWQLIQLPDSSIIGVASRSGAQPLKLTGFGDEDVTFENANCYCDWRFVYLPALGRVIPTGR